MKNLQCKAGLLCLSFVCASMFAPQLVIACFGQSQGGGFDSNIPDAFSVPIVTTSQQSGFNSVFDAGTANLTSSGFRADVNDATHSQLIGSALSPFDNALVNPQTDASPRTGITTDAQSTIGLNDFSFGGGGSQGFTAGGRQAFSAGTTAGRGAPNGFGLASTGGAFSGDASSRRLFSGHLAVVGSTGASASGQGGSPPQVQISGRSMQPLAEDGSVSEATGLPATDPVLTNSISGSEAGPELHGDLPVPSGQTASFFAEPSPRVDSYQYDDGQTPSLTRVPVAGAILGTTSVYSHALSGFPDSTKGLAASPTETEYEQSPLSHSFATEGSPFAPISGGAVYAPGVRLHPDIHTEPLQTAGAGQGHRPERLRALGGPAGAPSFDSYNQFQRELRHNQGRPKRKSTLTPAYQGGITGQKPIR